MREGYIQRGPYNGKGIYCFLQFDNLDEHNKAVFKIGLTTSFQNRVGHYHSYGPAGIWTVGFLREPWRLRDGRQDASFYREIEKYIVKGLIDRGGILVTDKTRKRSEDTEYIYTDFDTIKVTFKNAERRYGGRLELQDISGINDYATKQKEKAIYTGEIIFV